MAVISSNTNLSVSNTSSYDGDTVVKQYASLTINSGVTLTTANGCKGLVIFVQGDCVINGTISVKPSQGYSTNSVYHPIIQNSGSSLTNHNWAGCGSAITGLSTAINKNLSGNTGTTFTIDKNGSGDGSNEGGRGGGYPNCCWNMGSKSGGNPKGFAGGGGVGGGPGCHGGSWPNAPANGAGGNGAAYGCHGGGGGGGGGGIPGGTCGSGSGAQNGVTSTKNGTLVLIVGGNLSGSGTIDLRGSNGGRGGDGSYAGGGGGGSGGGTCYIAYAGDNTFVSDTSGTQTGTWSSRILLSGGSGGGAGSGSGSCGGGGGANGFVKVIAMA